MRAEKTKVVKLWILILLLALLGTQSLAEPPKDCCKQKETMMKSYTGKVEPMGMSMFMQGTHQLVDDSGEMVVILQAENGKVDLNKFVNKKVKVSGNEEPTVEAGGTILTVTSIDAI
ncbi:MAG: hypothetical protein KC800_22485 [Candidatus Eremiobacteraeota bacterium]|nr:hypothetical protein [Candidatus Eremiobacteraeota bacterium]